MPDASLSIIDPNTGRRTRRSAGNAFQVLAQLESEVAAGRDLQTVCLDTGISVATYYRWRARARGKGAHLDRTNQAILDAAKKVFLAEGFEASLDTVAKTARVARQTVYNRFGSKERLFRDVVQSIFEHLLGSVLVVNHGNDFISTLTIYGRHFMNMSLDGDSIALQRIAMAEYRNTPELLKLAYALRASHGIPVLTDYIAAYLREQMEQGVIEAADPLMCAEAFAGSFTLHERHRLMIGLGGSSVERCEEMLVLCVRLFARGLGYKNETTLTLRDISASENA